MDSFWNALGVYLAAAIFGGLALLAAMAVGYHFTNWVLGI